MIVVKDAPRKVAKCAGARYAKVLETHQRLEAELARAMRRWDKSREALRRAEKRLDKAQAATDADDHTDPFNDSL